MMRLWMRLATRFLVRHRRKSASIASFIIIGTAILTLMQGITTGINDTMITNTTRLHSGDLYAETPNLDVAGTAARSARKLLPDADVVVRGRFTGVMIEGGTAVPLTVFAVDPEAESRTTAISRRIAVGRYPASTSEMLLGQRAVNELGLTVGDAVELRGADGKPVRTVRLVGVFNTGIDHIDSLFAFIPRDAVARKAPPGMVGEVSVFTTNHDTSMLGALNESAPDGASFTPWFDLMPDLVQLIDLNETSMAIIMAFVYILVGFGIANVSILTVMERFREFGILKAMGVRPREVVRLVYLEGVMLFTAAAVSGILLGWLSVLVTARTGIDLSAFTSHNRYFVVTGVITPRLAGFDMLLTALFAAVVGLAASYIPARIAARKTAMETISAL